MAGGLLLAVVSGSVRAADLSPEFFQLLNELKEDVASAGVGAEGPVCVGQGLVLTRDVMAAGLGESLFRQVVVKPLEDGAKKAIGMLPQSVFAKGAVTAAVSTYDLIGCAMDSDGPRSYARCLGKVVLGVVESEATGRVKEFLHLEDPATTQAFDSSYKAAKGAIHGYKSKIEFWTYSTASGGCRSRVSARWIKNMPGRKGGTITLTATHHCDCPSRYSPLEDGSYRIVSVPVTYAPAPGKKPGWRLGPIPKIRAEAKCCGSGRGPALYLDSEGHKTTPPPTGEPTSKPPSGGSRPQTGTPPSGGEETGTATPPPPPPKPPPVVLPRPPLVEYTRANPCPPCRPIRDAIDAAAKEIGDLLRQRNAKLGEKNEQQSRRDGIEKRIARLEARLHGEGGTGASAYDPSTGLTTESVDTGDGRVRIRVTDSSGHVVSERFRPRKSTAQVKEDLAAAQKDLAAADAAIAALDRAIADLDAKRAAARQRYENLQRALDDCVARMCHRYATCEQLRKQIQAYRDAGLMTRSRSIVNRLMREAREKGCFDEDRFDREVGSLYDLTGERPPPQQTTVEVLRVEHIRGNQPFDARDPLGDGSATATATATTSATTPAASSVPMVEVINNIPISRLHLAGPDVCPSEHYHGSAYNCNGVFTVDPAPGACGQGAASAVTSIPVSSCPDL